MRLDEVRCLMRASFRYDAKVPNHPQRFARADSAVIYVAPRDLPVALELARALPRRTRTPQLAAPVADGLALAQSDAEPDGRPGPSFGEQRCGLIAEAVLTCPARPASWPRAIAARLRREGVDPKRPFVRADRSAARAAILEALAR